jgi:hypothetical protein
MKYFTTIFLLLFGACSLNKEDENTIEIYRFENQLFKTNDSNIFADRLKWEDKVGSFAFSYYNFLFNTNNDTIVNSQILSFINNNDMREVYDTINLRFSSITNLKDNIGNSLYNFKTLFPEYPIPNIITMFSGFNYGVIVEDSLIAIGLDFYLGKIVFFIKDWVIQNIYVYKSKLNLLLQMSWRLGTIVFLVLLISELIFFLN